MHLAAAAGTPTLGLFGPSPEARYRPWGPKASFVRPPESFEQLTGAPGFDFAARQCFMESLGVEAAETAARRLWAWVNRDPAGRSTLPPRSHRRGCRGAGSAPRGRARRSSPDRTPAT